MTPPPPLDKLFCATCRTGLTLPFCGHADCPIDAQLADDLERACHGDGDKKPLPRWIRSKLPRKPSQRAVRRNAAAFAPDGRAPELFSAPAVKRVHKPPFPAKPPIPNHWSDDVPEPTKEEGARLDALFRKAMEGS